MSRRGMLPILLLGILCGCEPPSSPVYVDLDEVLRQDLAPKAPPIEVPTPPQPMTPAQIQQPGRNAVTLRDPNRSSESEVRRAIEERQRRDYTRLVERLRDFYHADSLRFEQETLRKMSQEAIDAYEEANALIRELFERYGRERSPLVADLALLVGFPDPNPEGETPTVPLGNVDRQRLAKAQELRQKINALEAAFDRQTNSILASVEARTLQDLDAFRQRIRDYRIANDARAEKEAREQVLQSVRALGLQLTETAHLELPGRAPKTTVFGGAPAPEAPPKVTSVGVLTAPEDRRLLAKKQLLIWAGQRRYVLAGKRGAPDRTDEFITWRRRLLSGR